MKQSDGYWAAVALVAFGNLRIGRHNWRSLWGRAGWVGRPKTVQMYRKGRIDELRRAFESQLAGYGRARPQSDKDQVEKFYDAPRVVLDRSRTVELADFSADLTWGLPRARQYREVRDAHETTRRRLSAIADGTAAEVFDAASSLLDARTIARVAVGLRKSTTITLNGPKDEFERLGEYVDDLFLRAALAGLWPRFSRCAAHDCENFVFQRVSGREKAFCSGGCRGRSWRHDNAAIESRRDATILAERRQMLDAGMTFDAVDRRLTTRHNLSRGELLAVFKRADAEPRQRPAPATNARRRP